MQLQSYIYGNAASFADLTPVLSHWLTAHELTATTFHFAIRNTTAEQAGPLCETRIFVLLTDTLLPTDHFADFVRLRFLTPLTSRIVYPGVTERLSLVCDKDETPVLTVKGFAARQGEALQPFTYTRQLAQQQADSYQVVSSAFSLETYERLTNGAPIRAFTMQVGSRLVTCYAARHRPTCAFLFRNAYGAEETAAFDAATTVKQEVDRNLARLGGSSAFTTSAPRCLMKSSRRPWRLTMRTSSLPARLRPPGCSLTPSRLPALRPGHTPAPRRTPPIGHPLPSPLPWPSSAPSPASACSPHFFMRS